MPAVFNAANEIAVDAFCEKNLSFLGISKLVEEVMDRHDTITSPGLQQILESDQWARDEALRLVLESAVK